MGSWEHIAQVSKTASFSESQSFAWGPRSYVLLERYAFRIYLTTDKCDKSGEPKEEIPPNPILENIY